VRIVSNLVGRMQAACPIKRLAHAGDPRAQVGAIPGVAAASQSACPPPDWRAAVWHPCAARLRPGLRRPSRAAAQARGLPALTTTLTR
jgi:hypothetical protein